MKLIKFKNEGSLLLAKNEVRADIFSGSLAVFRNRKPTGECWRVMVQNARIFQLVVCVRKNSNRFRPKFVGRAEFPPNPPSARPQKRPFWTCLPACQQAGQQAGWTISSFSLAANSFNSEI